MKSPLRIAHLNFARSWRGGEQQTLYLARFLQQQKVSQTVIVYPASELAKRCQQWHIPIFPLALRSGFNVFAVLRIALFIIGNQIQLLHAHTAKAHTIGLLVKYLCQLRGYKVRLVVSRRVDFPRHKNFLSRRKYLSPLVDVYLAVSHKVKEILIADGIEASKIHVVHSGIDPTPFTKPLSAKRRQELRQEFHITQELVLGNVAALAEHKDHKTLLKAAALLTKQKVPPWKLLIIGDGELRSELEALALNLQLKNYVSFTGFRQDIPELLNFIDIFVMSSKEEGLGTSLLDAMAAGLPIAATQAGGIPEIVVANKGGLLSPIQDAAALAHNLAQLLQKPALRKKLGSFNQKQVKNFHYQKTAAATLSIYHAILKT